MSIAVMKQALEALEIVVVDVKTTPTAYEAHRQAITALRTAIEQAEKQKPVAWAVAGEVTDWSKDFSAYQTQTYTRPVYTTPPAAPVQEPSEALRLAMDWYDSGHEDREEFKAMMENLLVAPAAQRPVAEPHKWVGLTDEEIMKLLAPLYSDPSLVPWAIEVSMDEYRAIEAKLREKNGGQA